MVQGRALLAQAEYDARHGAGAHPSLAAMGEGTREGREAGAGRSCGGGGGATGGDGVQDPLAEVRQPSGEPTTESALQL